MNIKKAVTKYPDNKCADCGKNIKKGETIFIDVDAVPKVPYCYTCGMKRVQAKDIKEPENLSEDAFKDTVLFKLNHIIGRVNKIDEFINGIQETWKPAGEKAAQIEKENAEKEKAASKKGGANKKK